jgi:hypothetical protein
MQIKSALFAAVVLASTFAGAAQATPTWTFAVSGTIDSGTDFVGAFGAVGQDLTGLHFSETLTTSVNPAHYADKDLTGSSTSYSGYFPGFVVTATVNGVTVSETVTTEAWGKQLISNAVSAGVAGTDTVSTDEYGFDDDGKQAFARLYAYTSDPALGFVSALDFSQFINASNPALKLFASFRIAQSDFSQVEFSGTPDSFTVNAGDPTSDVPEPASLALIGLGVAGMGALRRRKAS